MARSDTARLRGKPVKQRSELADTLIFLVKLVIFVAIFRSFLFAPYSIPSESMLPRLEVGDYLFVSKWNYGYSRYSLPFSLPLWHGRVLGHLPARGDVVVFKAPPGDKEDYIKRVIGLPGDTVQMRNGVLILNGKPVPKVKIADFIVPVSPNYQCAPGFAATDPAGKAVCRYPQFRETLPSGRSYDVLDWGETTADETGVYKVPAGHLFMMGDNRDDSEDSRFAQSSGGIGMVPIENLEGKALVTFWSTDGSAQWLEPWTWFTAARPGRIGHGF
jgi:signal peptidase I